MFLSRFWGNFVSMEKKKEGRRILILRSAIASTSHLKIRFRRFRIRENMWWTCYRMTMVMASLTLKMRTIPTLTMKTTNCKLFPFPPEIIQFEMIHLPNCSQSTTMLPFRNLLKYCSDKKNKNKNVSFLNMY